MMRLDLKKALQEIRKRRAKTVAIQIPEGLKQRLTEIASEIEEKTGAKTFSFVEPCYGACDLRDNEAKSLGAQLLVHFGHTRFLEKAAIATVYIPLEYEADKKEIAVLAGKLASLLKEKKIKRVALCSTIQFKKHRLILRKKLQEKGFDALEGKGTGVEAGQVLGCNYSSVKAVEGKAQAIVFVGDGLFHAVGLSFAANRPVFAFEPLQNETMELERQRDLFLRKRIAMVEKARQAKSIAVWISTKKGQQRTALALALKEKFEKQGKKAFVLASNALNPDCVLGVKVDAIACTACPRIAFDDSAQYSVPIISPAEALIVLGEKKLEEYAFDELC